MFTASQLKRWTDKFGDRAEGAMIVALQYAGEYFVKAARETGNYNDITGNLRSSIGYLVARDGQVISENYERGGRGSDQETGVQEGARLAHELALAHSDGLVLIGVAGMDYAVYVENMDNKDVISSSETRTKALLKDLIKQVFDGR